MSDSDIVNLAGYICCFNDYVPTFGIMSWKWKLDAYRCHNDLDKTDLWFCGGEQNIILPQIVAKVSETQTGFFLHQIFKLKDKGTLWQYVRKERNDTLLSYYVSCDWRKVALLEDHTESNGNMAFEYLCHIMPSCGLALSMLTFHGVLLEHGGKGLIISAPSGTGKTTHARLWRDNKHALIINGDRAVCRKADGIWTGFGLPWSGTSGEQINRSAPIKAMVVLEQSESNEAFRMKDLEAFGAVLPNILCPTWDADLTGKAMDLLNDFLQEIPVIRLRCRPDPEAVEVLSKVLEEL